MVISFPESWSGKLGLTDYQTRWDRIIKLGQPDLANKVTVRVFGGTEMQLGETDSVRVRA